ncbi:MAG: hypothetical protein ACE5GE_08435 [Phycisphaerae bacterium]
MNGDNSLTRLFARHISEEPDETAGRVEFGLVHHLTEQRRFSSLEALLAYCRDPRNLREFLPDRRDQAMYSRRLVRRLVSLRQKLERQTGDRFERPVGRSAAGGASA